MKTKMAGKRLVSLFIFGVLFFIIAPLKVNAADGGVYITCIKGCNTSNHMLVESIDSNTNNPFVHVFLGKANDPDSPVLSYWSFQSISSVDPNVIKVGSIIHIDNSICSDVSIVKVLHKCKEAGHVSLIEQKAATCTSEGVSTNYYKCNVYGCERCWADENCTQPITNPDSYTIPALGHDFTKSVNGSTLSYSACRNGCDKSGGSLSINVQKDPIVSVHIMGADSFKEGTGIKVTEDQLEYYKYNDSKEKYEKVSGISGEGTYYASLSVEDQTIKEDFTVGNASQF